MAESWGETVTGDEGLYALDDLPFGEYVMAFAGDILNRYDGVTRYQVNGPNDSDTNGGVVMSLPGIDKTIYPYVIQYDIPTPYTLLHDIESIRDGSVK